MKSNPPLPTNVFARHSNTSSNYLQTFYFYLGTIVRPLLHVRNLPSSCTPLPNILPAVFHTTAPHSSTTLHIFFEHLPTLPHHRSTVLPPPSTYSLNLVHYLPHYHSTVRPPSSTSSLNVFHCLPHHSSTFFHNLHIFFEHLSTVFHPPLSLLPPTASLA